ncbi:MAG: transposase [Chthonomonadaceae bacterium]|nr:transposase [Chthonomonadaceae bacterium]
MKRRRFETQGEVRFLTFSCHRHAPLLCEEWAKDICVDHLALCRDRLGFRVYAFVFMPDHVHLMIQPDVDVATVRRIPCAIKTRTATKILERLREDGVSTYRLWQPGGGYDRNIHSDKEFHEKLDYIESNPVRKGLVAKVEDYAWSSAGSRILGRDVW